MNSLHTQRCHTADAKPAQRTLSSHCPQRRGASVLFGALSRLTRLWNKTKFSRRDGKFSSLIIIPQIFRKVKLFTAYFVEEVTFCGTTLRATGVGVSREVTALRGACGRGFLLSPFVLILYHNFNRFANFQVIHPLQYRNRFVFHDYNFGSRLRRSGYPR